MEIERIIEIADGLGFEDLQKELRTIAVKSTQIDCPLVLPLVGEFSAGKTTLINALTDSKKLETASEPTTATIYEIHFGNETCHARVLNADNSITEVSEIAELKNEILADAKVVEVYDTSNRVPSSTILVDTPGLSSPVAKHKQTLIEFLPQADAVLLTIDINTGDISRSLLNFVNDMKLAKKQVFVVITYCCSKPVSVRASIKELVKQHMGISEDCIVCVSAKEGELDELYALFGRIQKSKNDIIKRVNEYRVKRIADEMLKRIDELLKASNSDKDADEAINKQQYELNKIRRNIDNLIQSIQSDVEEIERNTIRGFEDKIFDRLDSLVAGKSSNFDAEAVAAVNTTASLFIGDYKNSVQECLSRKANERKSDDAIQLRSVTELDMSSYNVNGLSYNLNLNQVGHEYDGLIATGLKVAAVAAAAYAGGSAAGEGAMFDAADTASDVLFDGDKVISQVSSSATQQNSNSGNGIVESVVGYFTEQYAGKPQRRRAIHTYMDGTLLPEFKAELKRITMSLTSSIRQGLRAEAESSVSAMTTALEEMKHAKASREQEFKLRMEQLRDYKNELLTI